MRESAQAPFGLYYGKEQALFPMSGASTCHLKGLKRWRHPISSAGSFKPGKQQGLADYLSSRLPPTRDFSKPIKFVTCPSRLPGFKEAIS
jgi:hypothetical protein